MGDCRHRAARRARDEVRVSEAAISRTTTPTVAKTANVFAKGALVVLLVMALLYPD
jgi:hypothetical protein